MTDNTITPRPLGPADEALLATEQEITALWSQIADLRAAGDKDDHEEISSKAFLLDDYIAKLAPDSLVGAAVKLRRLADPIVGMETGESEHDIKSLRHILAVVERSISSAPVPSAGTDTGRLEKQEHSSITALVEKRFRLVEQTEEAVSGLGHDDGDKIVDAMTEAMNALDQRIVDRVPASADDVIAQLRLYREMGEGTNGWVDNRDGRLFDSMLAGLAGLRDIAAKGGAA